MSFNELMTKMNQMDDSGREIVKKKLELELGIQKSEKK